MKNIWRVVIIGVLAIIAFNIVIGLLGTVLGFAFKVLIPLAVLGVVVYAIYSMSGGKSLGGRNGKYLP
ncbi:MAG: hypothetical protein JNJ45_03280 [Chthonomonas sp.]|nr:hypothetical protein [Chthonomonas sp.]